MHSNDLFQELMAQFISGEITPEGKATLLTLLDNPQHQEELDSLLRTHYDTVRYSLDTPQETRQFIKALRQKMAKPNDEKNLFSWRKIAVAASFVVAAGLGYFSYRQNTNLSLSQKEMVVSDAKPAAAGAILTLGDGSKIVLDSVANGVLASQNQSVVTKKKDALVYAQNNSSKSVYNTMTTPRARRYNLTLADGTKVWLNAASSIRFPTVFNATERKVSITGEAYFEVAKDAKHPFKVAVNDMEVTVLGTHFNINSYSDESSIKTTLLEGSILLTKNNKKALLKPGEQADVTPSGSVKVSSDIDLEAVMAWKNGIFYFNNASVQTVLREISRWYDMDIVYEKGVAPRYFEGEIQRDLQLSQVIKILDKNNIHLKIEGKTIRVMP